MDNDVPCVCTDTNWLVRHLHDPDVRVLEVSSSPCTYKCGHIPGAQYLNWTADLQDSAARILVAVQRLNIGKNIRLVLYGDEQNRHAQAACMLLKKTYPRACVLEGGKERWVAESRTLSRDVLAYPSAKPEDVLTELEPVASYNDIV